MVPSRARRLPPPTLLLIVLGLLALGTAGCGVEAGQEGAPASNDPQVTATSDPAPAPDPSVDRLQDVYTALGFTEDEAQCLAEAMGDLAQDGTTISPEDTAVLMDLLNGCDIPLSRMMELGEGTDGTAEGGFRAGIEASLRAQGLTADQAACVAEGYLDQFGTDPTAAADPAAMAPLLEDCGA